MSDKNMLLGYNLLNHTEGSAFIIAEAGINHDGKFDKARKLIDVAVAANCSCVKFQSFKTDNTSSTKAITAPYIEKGSNKNETFYQLSKRLELSFDEQRELSVYSQSQGITFASSHFDEESLEFLVELGVPFLKVASGELTNYPLLKMAAKTGLPIFISTGMASLDEIDDVYQYLKGQGAKQLYIMHCVSVYPADYEMMNVKFIDTLFDKYKTPIGFSDHTLGISVPIGVRARGVKFFEKHYTISTSDFGPDHSASLNPEELKQMVISIDQVGRSLGNGNKVVNPYELEQRMVHRKSIVANRDIKKGQILTQEDLVLKKPGLGIEPKYIDDVIGCKTLVDIELDSCISWDLVEKNK
jgi:N,N'-diacetyllegionaminate synthase